MSRSIVSQTRDVLHFSEDEDAVIMGSLDLRSDYIDDCPWVSVTPYAPDGIRGHPDGSSSKDMVGGPAKAVFQSSSLTVQNCFEREKKKQHYSVLK